MSYQSRDESLLSGTKWEQNTVIMAHEWNQPYTKVETKKPICCVILNSPPVSSSAL